MKFIGILIGLLIGPCLALPANAAETIKLGYIYKMGDAPWFVREIEGAKKRAKEIGVELLVQDVQTDSNLAVTTMDTYIGDGVDGIAIVAPDRAIGPVVTEKARTAGIPLIAVDDDIKSDNGSVVPYVGINGFDMGKRVGDEIAALIRAEGWQSDFANVKVGSVEDQKADTCMQRNRGAQAALFSAYPELKEKVISIPYDNSMVSAIDAVSTTMTANPDAQKWVFFACNDDGVLGAVRATENSAMPAADVIGVGFDGSRSCEAFGSGTPSGFRATMWIDSANDGAIGIQALYDLIKNATPMKDIYYVDPTKIDASNFDSMKQVLGCK
ncbi:arabinose ABC transporter substrate-binding protein (plasmid) [Rhizobium acidisoli]|uniref:L-arabinose-binding periplasmic protein n=1 Tax=Rhizobium acidisoli TaxID=1538158 RepID=A0AAE6C4K1_9HYPH|nr:substrate-binding domain-containing protein [Rhizobium acidisoli]KPH04246.1 L-arabinose-binding protein [Rhizobium acidisoli]QAS81840.1 arabinose ABC transporter substrate-binding protein [Rhizobium acidisoli]